MSAPLALLDDALQALIAGDLAAAVPPLQALREQLAGGLLLPPGCTWSQAQRYLVLHALLQARGKRPLAARALGISVRSLYNYLKATRPVTPPKGEGEG